MNRSIERRVRELIIEASLGEASPAEITELEELLRQDDGQTPVQQEWYRMRTLVAMLRAARSVKPSPRFRAALRRRLAEVDRTGIDGVLAGALKKTRFHWQCFRLRVELSRALRWRIAAASLVVLCGIVWTVHDRTVDRSSLETAFVPEETASAERGVPPPGDSTVRSADPATPKIKEFEPLFTDGGPPLEVPRIAEPAPDGPELIEEPADGDPVQPPIPDLSKAADLVVRDIERPRFTENEEGTRGVVEGMHWLLRQQREDGSFSAGWGEPDIGVGVSALALMALVSGFAEAPAAVNYVDVQSGIDRAVSRLLSHQDRSGWIGETKDPATRCFNHAVASLALHEWSLFQPDVPTRAQRDSIAQALDAVDLELGWILQLSRATGSVDPAQRRCLSHNAAWCSLTLASASANSHDWVAAVGTEHRVEEVLARLSAEPSMLTATRAMLMSYKESVAPVPLDGWEEVVGEILKDPGQSDPALVFMVATAMCPRTGDPASARWESFRRDVEDALLSRQDHEHGFFRPALSSSFSCFAGGDVYETALALLTLEVPSRARRLSGR